MNIAVSLPSIALYFLRLGIIGFGGPPAHIALMRRDLVEKRGWLSADQFQTDLATANLLPGPTSTEMAIYAGLRLRGTIGALVAGWCFILPAATLVGVLAWAYVTWGSLDWMTQLLYGIKPVAFALVVSGILQLCRGVTWSRRSTAIAIAAFAALVFARVDVLLLFLIAGLAYTPPQRSANPTPVSLTANAYAKITITLGVATGAASAAALLWEFFKIGAVIYGGGFALIGVLQQTFVEQLGWVTQRQLLDAIAVGQSTPGPVFTTATFLGYLLAGIPGAVAATVGIFSPAFVFVRLEQLLLGQLRRSRFADSFSRFLQGVHLAVLATLADASLTLGRDALSDPLSLFLCAGALVALTWKKIDAHWLVGVGLLIGIIRLALS